MKYSEWNPEVHTMQDDPIVCLTYEWNRFMKGKGAKSIPEFIHVGQHLFDYYSTTMLAFTWSYNHPINETPSAMFKCTKMYSTGKPGWDFEFSDIPPPTV